MQLIHHHRTTPIVAVLIAFLLITTVQGKACYRPGPAFPKRTLTASLLESTFISQRLNHLIEDILTGKTDLDGWSTDNTSFAIQLTSSNETLWESYYTAPQLGNYTDSDPAPVTGDTAFRIASISKTFTVYSLLLQADIRLDDPITKYLPELKNQSAFWLVEKDWDQISLRSLASQLSGLGRGFGSTDIATPEDELPDPWKFGFPPISENDTDDTSCGINSTIRPYLANDIIRIARDCMPMLFPTNERSTYSNIGFSLLGLALENATGKSYSEIIQQHIVNPLNLTNTGTEKPKDSGGVIPVGRNDWGEELGYENPTGGIYSTASDLSKYLRSLLSATPPLLSRSTISSWLQPHSRSIFGRSSMYGIPWEILRKETLLKSRTPLDIITKGGALNGYYSTIALIPDLDIGLTILVAGSSAGHVDLRERLIARCVFEVERLVAELVRIEYEGTFFKGEFYEPLDESSRMTIAVSETDKAVHITEWISNNTDFLATYGRLKGMPPDKSNWTARLIPTFAYELPPSQRHYQRLEQWTLMGVRNDNYDDVDSGDDINTGKTRTKMTKERIFDDFCLTDIDNLHYGGLSIETFLFVSMNTASENPWDWRSVIAYPLGMRCFMFRISRDGAGGPESKDEMRERMGGFSTDDRNIAVPLVMQGDDHIEVRQRYQESLQNLLKWWHAERARRS